jgi:hypothetical protein
MKNITTSALCSLLITLTACGGGGSSGGKSTSSSVVVSSSAVAFSSTVAVSSSMAVSSSTASSSLTTSSSVATSTSSALSSDVATSSSSTTSSSSATSSSAANVSSASSSSIQQVAVQTGVFIDSAVAGVTYRTVPGNFSGTTTATGQYQFAEGDTVTFSIGDIEFPSVVAKGVVTPVDMAPGNNAESQIVKNIAVLLQSLDADGDPSNGITIPATAAAAAIQTVTFDQSASGFSSQILSLVQHADSNRTVVPESTAVAHLQESLAQVNASALVGTWYVKGEGYQYALFIIDGENYAAVDNDTSEGMGTMLETGKYSWNQATGIVTVTDVYKTINDLDAYPPMANGNTLKLDGNTLTVLDGDETFVLTRLMPTAESPLQGGWVMGDDEEKVVFAFTGTNYLMGQKSPEDEVGQSGAEVGTYTYDLGTNEIVVATLQDSNGQWGLSHPCAVLSDGDHPQYEESNYLACTPSGRDIVQTLTVTGDTLTFISEADTIANDDEEAVLFERVNGVPDGNIHLKLNLTLSLQDYLPGERFEVSGASMQCNLLQDEGEELKESWVLGIGANSPTWVATIPATYDPETKKITFDVTEARQPVQGHPGFYEKFHETLTATYNPGETNVITGTYTEAYDLTWDKDDSVSSCEAIYSVTGVLR